MFRPMRALCFSSGAGGAYQFAGRFRRRSTAVAVPWPPSSPLPTRGRRIALRGISTAIRKRFIRFCNNSHRSSDRAAPRYYDAPASKQDARDVRPGSRPLPCGQTSRLSQIAHAIMRGADCGLAGGQCHTHPPRMPASRNIVAGASCQNQGREGGNRATRRWGSYDRRGCAYCRKYLHPQHSGYQCLANS